MIHALFRYQFLQHALTAGLLCSVICGIIGVIIVEKKLVMMSGGIAHTSYCGVGLGYLLGFEPVVGALAVGVAAALAAGFIKRRGGARFDVAVGLLWSLGMALGILFIALSPGYPPDLSSYLFGNILSVTRADLYLMLALTAVVVLAFGVLFHNFMAYLFDDEYARVIGIPAGFLEYLLLVLVALSVVVLIRVVGIVLVMALLTAPAAIAGLTRLGLWQRMALAALLSAVFCMAGLWASYALGIASGAAIVLLSVAAYLVAYALRRLLVPRPAARKEAR